MSLFEYKYACYEYDKHFQHQKSILNTLDYDYDIFKEHLIALNNKK
jgi:hypothetical protein